MCVYINYLHDISCTTCLAYTVYHVYCLTEVDLICVCFILWNEISAVSYTAWTKGLVDAVVIHTLVAVSCTTSSESFDLIPAMVFSVYNLNGRPLIIDVLYWVNWSVVLHKSINHILWTWLQAPLDDKLKI